MRFLEVKSGEFIAIDTIAKIADVKSLGPKSDMTFSITTKRGDVYFPVQLCRFDFEKLTRG